MKFWALTRHTLVLDPGEVGPAPANLQELLLQRDVTSAGFALAVRHLAAEDGGGLAGVARRATLVVDGEAESDGHDVHHGACSALKASFRGDTQTMTMTRYVFF